MNLPKQEKYELISYQEIETILLYPYPNHSKNWYMKNH